MNAFLLLAAFGVVVGVSIGWLLLAGSAQEIFREW